MARSRSRSGSARASEPIDLGEGTRAAYDHRTREVRPMRNSGRWSVAGLIVAVLALSGRLGAQDFVPAVVFDMGGKFDKSFNEAAYNGAERFKKETGIQYREFEVTAEAQREQALRNMA